MVYKKVKAPSSPLPEAELEGMSFMVWLDLLAATPAPTEEPKKKKAVNVFDFNPATFISITARHPPRKV